jgi:hypothetical protein
MSTRFSVNKKYGKSSIDLGYSGSAADDVQIPSCGLEDIDRALFNLFNSDLPLIYEKKNNETKKIPVIFATGERFAINRRKDPFRDKNGAIIVPLISILRTGIDQKADKLIDMGDIGTIDIKRKLSKDDALYQQIINSQNLKNTGVLSRREKQESSSRKLGGRLLEPNLAVGIYETISIPTPKFFTASYEVTIWTQFMQHANNILTTIMSSYHNVKARSFRIETENGYWFNVFFDSDIGSDNSFDNMSDEERTIKHTFKVSIPGFIINPQIPGVPSGIRKSISATQFSFGIIEGVPDEDPKGNVNDMRINAHVLDDVATVDDPVSTQTIGSNPTEQSTKTAGGLKKSGTSSHQNPTTALGGTESSSIMVSSVTKTLSEDPITGEPMDVTYKSRMISAAHGEQVLTNLRKTFSSNNDKK